MRRSHRLVYLLLLGTFSGSISAQEPMAELAGDLVYDATEVTTGMVIAVMPFEDQTEGNKRSKLGDAVAEELTTALIKRKITVVERSELKKVLREVELGQTGMLSDSQAAKVGQGLGAKGIVVGTVRQTEGGGVRVNARLILISDLRALSAGATTLNRDLVARYRDPERHQKRDTVLIDIMGSLSLMSIEWIRNYDQKLANPVSPSNSDTYKTSETYGSVSMRPAPGFAARVSYLPILTSKAYGEIFFISVGMQYTSSSSAAQSVNYQYKSDVWYQSIGTTNPASVNQTRNYALQDGGYNVSFFAVKPGIFGRYNLSSDDLTFIYLGTQLNYVNMKWKNPVNQISSSQWMFDITLGLRYDFGPVGLILEASLPFYQNIEYQDDQAFINFAESKVSISGFNFLTGLSFAL